MGLFEDLLSRLVGVSGIGAQVVDHGIVKAQYRQVELRKDHMFVVPAISKDSGIVGITREVETDRALARDKL